MAATKSHLAPQAPQEIQHQELARLFGRIVGYRVLTIPFFVALTLGVAYVEPYGWRSVVLSGIAIGAACFFVFELAQYRRKGLTPGAVPRNLIAAAVGIVVLMLGTGGAASPVAYPMLVVAVVMGVSLSRRLAATLVVLLITSVWIFAWFGDRGTIPDLNLEMFGGGARVSKGPVYLYAHAAVLSIGLALASQVGNTLRRSFDSILCRAFAAQQESLSAHTEQVQQLTALSGEIAHELKNPLASVKGLSALLAQNITEGKQAERLEVLRREVDRMQSVLDEFLNFSRPLSPLSIVDTDLAAICEEVAVLHEGLQVERGVRIEVAAESLSVRCDPRKLKQILINLVQNALDASPSGGTIVMQARTSANVSATADPTSRGRAVANVSATADPTSRGGAVANVSATADPTSRGGAVANVPTIADPTSRGGAAAPTIELRVVDEGRGLDPKLGDVFQPGVTSKSAGSGLGLTIARALARQHGGDLVLLPRREGGTIAQVTLPNTPGPLSKGSETGS